MRKSNTGGACSVCSRVPGRIGLGLRRSLLNLLALLRILLGVAVRAVAGDEVAEHESIEGW